MSSTVGRRSASDSHFSYSVQLKISDVDKTGFEMALEAKKQLKKTKQVIFISILSKMEFRTYYFYAL